jgi:DNA-binding GntR family transcriptional regulator
LAAGKVDTRGLLRIEKSARSNTVSRDKGNRIGYFLDANREFHLAIAIASGNDRLARNISSLLDEMKRLVALGFVAKTDSPEIDGDHHNMIDALASGDADLAKKLTYDHIVRFRDMTLEKVLQSFTRDTSQMLLVPSPKRASK